MPEHYNITLQGYLDADWSGWFAGMQISHPDQDTTLLRGPLADQSALYGLIERIRDLNLTLISIVKQPSCGAERNLS